MNLVMKAIARVHRTIYQLSGGRLGTEMGGQDILLLHHVGAKSGKRYTSPLGYVLDGDAYVLVAAAAGQPNHPGWYHNLKQNPDATINVRGKQIQVLAEIALKEKRDKLWAEMSADLPQLNEFQAKTTREIPIVLLHSQ